MHVLLEKLKNAQLLKKGCVQWTWKFITTKHGPCHQSRYSYPIPFKPVLISDSHLCIRLPCYFFLENFGLTILWEQVFLIADMRATCPTHNTN